MTFYVRNQHQMTAMALAQAGAVVTRLPAHPNGQLDLDAVLDHLGARHKYAFG